MMDLVFDEIVGWYDPNEAYCANSCGNKATEENWIGMIDDSVLTELLCEDCKKL